MIGKFLTQFAFGRENKNVTLPLGLFLLSLVLGISYVAEMAAKDIFFYTLRPGTDMYTFYEQARWAWLFPKLVTDFKVPFYSHFFLVKIFSVLGANLLWVRVIQSVFCAASVVLVYLLAKKMFGEKTAIIAGITALLYGRFYIYSDLILSETLAVFLALAFLLLFLNFLEKKSYLYLVFSSLSLGVLILIRLKLQIAALFLSVFIVSWFWEERRKAFSFLGVFLLITFLVVGPQRIAQSFGSAGKLFLLCNSEQAEPLLTERARPALESLPLQEKNVQAAAYEKAGRFIVKHPAGFLRLFFDKFILFFGNTERGYDNFPPQYYRRISTTLKFSPLGWGLIMPLGVLGLFYYFPRRRYRMLYVFIGGYLLSVFAFQIADRYRLITEPLFIIFSAAFLNEMIGKARQERKVFLRFLGAAIVLILLVNFPLAEKKIFKLVHPRGLCFKENNGILIRDNLPRFSELDYKARFADPSQRVIKKLIIDEPPSGFHSAMLLVDGYFLEGFDLSIAVNGRKLQQNWHFPGIAYPYLGTLKIPVPVDYLKEKENVFELGTETPGKVFIFIDRRYDYNRSAFYSAEKGLDYDDLGSFSVLGDGEYRVSLELLR